ncbi:CoA pyrophosphatase [Tistrella bauzanensis]|uniref:CoA pyrophosphatase n=1 Tax=Tistrella arctica TaxID=3133430 RepID=A0ABU9YR33_9PROT
MTVAADIVAVFNDSLPNAVGIDPDTPAVNGDYVLNPGSRIAGAKRPAAVLVPLVERSAGLTVLLTQRTQHLHAHAGQVAFPGGRVDEGDIDAVDTALRETREEIGVDRAHIRIIGRLDTYETTTGFHVVPIVGLVTPPVEIIPDPFEVAEVFEVPLSFFMDPRNRKRHSLERGGVVRHWYAFPFGRYYIWGATAGMLVNLTRVLDAGLGLQGADLPAAPVAAGISGASLTGGAADRRPAL